MGIPIWPFSDLNSIVQPPSVILLLLVLLPSPKQTAYDLFVLNLYLHFIPCLSTSHNMLFIVLTNKAVTAISSAKAGLPDLISKIPRDA